MPPRLPFQCAARALAQPSSRISAAVAFSTSSVVASPPREPPHPHHRPHGAPAPAAAAPTSSTSSLLSIDRAPRNAGNSSTQNTSDRGDAASRLLSRYKDRAEAAVKTKQAQVEFLRNRKISNDYLRQMPRRWDAGDVYSPHDMSPVEMQKWRRRSPRKDDVVDVLGIRPLDMYKNFSLAQEFTSSSGQITHSSGTSLRPVNQRKIAKMIRRIQGMGIYPTIHDHPEMLREDFYPNRN